MLFTNSAWRISLRKLWKGLPSGKRENSYESEKMKGRDIQWEYSKHITEKTRKEPRESEINTSTKGANYIGNILVVSRLDGASPLAGNIVAAKGNNTAAFHVDNVRSLVELNAIVAFRQHCADVGQSKWIRQKVRLLEQYKLQQMRFPLT